ncbi:RNA polymerase sigma-70 factor [Rhodohalobacter sp. 8-1]|uniref:RNA polymerase sigma-70 factor n=1 Tax=Rhodohalobacter sp. 8-1 TaxID=3131972 RepID=UPI0030ED99AA
MTIINSSSNNQDDDFWVENIQYGDKKAFEILFKKYYLPLTRFIWRYVNSKAIAEELIQELFTILWEKKDDWDMDTEKSIRAYLYKSARNLALNQIRHQEIKEKYDTEWMSRKENPVIEFHDEYREERIRNAITKAIEELPARSKMTYKLHRYDGLTYPEIAEVMEVSVKTVESQMTRTLKILRDQLSHLLPYLIIALLAV